MKIPNYQIESFIQKIDKEKIAGCLLFGPNQSLVSYRFNQIAKKIVNDLKDSFLVSNLGKNRVNQDKSIIVDEFFSYSMFGGRKLITIRDCDATTTESLKNLFNQKDFLSKSDNFILITASDLDKSSQLRKISEDQHNFAAIPCYEDEDQMIIKFIENELNKYCLKYPKDLAKQILEIVEKDRNIIASEIEKLSIYVGEKKFLDFEVILKVFSLSHEENIYEIISEIIYEKNHNLAAKIEKMINSGFEPILLIRYINNYLQKLYFAKIDIEINKLGLELAVKRQSLFFKAENQFKKDLNFITLNFLQKKLKKIFEAEINLKTKNINPANIISSYLMF